VETAVPLGERRSLVIVSVEGRRILLGLTPGQISDGHRTGNAGQAMTPNNLNIQIDGIGAVSRRCRSSC
jgi:flagellar biogenesis protein FliO